MMLSAPKFLYRGKRATIETHASVAYVFVDGKPMVQMRLQTVGLLNVTQLENLLTADEAIELAHKLIAWAAVAKEQQK